MIGAVELQHRGIAAHALTRGGKSLADESWRARLRPAPAAWIKKRCSRAGVNPLNQCGKPARPAESLANVPYRARRWRSKRRQPDGTLTGESHGGLQGTGLTKRPSDEKVKRVPLTRRFERTCYR